MIRYRLKSNFIKNPRNISKSLPTSKSIRLWRLGLLLTIWIFVLLWFWSLLTMETRARRTLKRRLSTRPTSSSEKTRTTFLRTPTTGTPRCLTPPRPNTSNNYLTAYHLHHSEVKPANSRKVNYKLWEISGIQTLLARAVHYPNSVSKSREASILRKFANKNKTTSTKRWNSRKNRRSNNNSKKIS